MAAKKFLIRASAGDHQPKNLIEPRFEAFCQALQDAFPTVGYRTTLIEQDRAQLLIAIGAKAAQVSGAAHGVLVNWGKYPELHEIDAKDPTVWTTNATAQRFDAMVTKQDGTTVTQYFSISFES